MPRAALADRFGRPGLRRARSPAGATTRCARGSPPSAWRSALELPESASGAQLERALGLLIDRLLARRERRGRTLRAAVLSARAGRGRDLARAGDVPRGAGRPAPDAARARAAAGRAARARPRRCACAPRASARRRATSARCWPSRRPCARARLREAVRQARSVAGPEAALRILRRGPRLARARAPPRATPWEP